MAVVAAMDAASFGDSTHDDLMRIRETTSQEQVVEEGDEERSSFLPMKKEKGEAEIDPSLLTVNLKNLN